MIDLDRATVGRGRCRGLKLAAAAMVAGFMGWAGNGAVAASPSQPTAQPTLNIASDVPARPGDVVVVPLSFKANEAAIASLAFSVDFDADLLSIDPTDADGDGIPDAVALHLPGAFVATVMLDPGDTDGEIDFVITDLLPPLAELPDGSLVEMTFTVAQAAASQTAAVRFSRDPAPSFGSTAGASVPGVSVDGSVRIMAGPAALLHLPWLARAYRP